MDLLAKGEVLEKEVLLKQLLLVHHNSLQLLKLVNSLLDFSKIKAGRMQASFQPLDLTQLTQYLTSTLCSCGTQMTFAGCIAHVLCVVCHVHGVLCHACGVGLG